jgi:hypothetical protein
MLILACAGLATQAAQGRFRNDEPIERRIDIDDQLVAGPLTLSKNFGPATGTTSALPHLALSQGRDRQVGDPTSALHQWA